MNWKIIWELVKINILYSNPQTLTALKKKQERKPNKKFSAYKSMFQQQAIMIAVFMVIYLFMFVGMDFARYPGYFSFYVAIFFVMATISAFTAMYTIFYESNDVKLYVYLPVKSSELYVAKIISSLGMGSVFLMPLLSLFGIAYWQIAGAFVAIPLAILLFAILLVSSMTLALYLNSLIGRVIVRSPKRKLISTALMFLSTFGAVGLIFYLNATNQTRMVEEGVISDRGIVPYFRGFHDVVVAPWGLNALLNFWLPLLVLVLLIVGIITYIMPNYYQEALYVNAKSQARRIRKPKETIDASLSKVMIRHHLSTLQNATLLTQTYLMPLIFAVSFVMPMAINGSNFSTMITPDYFGIALLVGMILGSMCSTPTSFLGVGISLERENYTFFKSLPLNFKRFLHQKFLVLLGLQVIIPVLVYAGLGLVVLKFHPILVVSFVLGFILMASLQGEFVYRRDYKLLDLKWQDVTQLFTRGAGQWTMMAFMFGNLIFGGIVVAIAIFASIITKNPLAVNSAVTIASVLLLGLTQLFVNKIFWKQLG